MTHFELTKPVLTSLTTHGSLGQRFEVKQIKRGGLIGSMRVLLGGIVVAEAREMSLTAPESLIVRLQFHGGRNTWMVELERVSPYRIYPRADWWGTLPEMMAAFQRATGIELPAISIADIGVGISEYTAKGVSVLPGNPWRLEVGQTYHVTRDRLGDHRRFQVVERAGRVEICFESPDGLSESFDPTLVLNEMAWLTLRRVDASEQLVAAPVAQPAARSMRP
ncbi:hypothetical protein [Paucibacter soli]|uniref:hypothetical protein n=1 Tax=Paucibacter soli TaxID=3133433 RepID=UPI0030A641B5